MLLRKIGIALISCFLMGSCASASAQDHSTCKARGAYPDYRCSPGAAIQGVTDDDICRAGYSASVRNVSKSLKNTIYREYGITSHQPNEYEVDHIISLELGGSNDRDNLWPEPADPRPGFHEKDKVENYLHGKVCNHTMTLTAAQRLISKGWVRIYRRIAKPT